MLGALLLSALAARPAAAADDYALPAPPPGRHADYSADKAEFDGEHSTLHLSGGVVLKESTMTVKGEDLWIDTARRSGRSDGALLVEDGVSAVYGDSGEFDFAKHTGRLFHSSAGMADWRVHAREAELGQDRRLRYVGADFTSCAAVPPDYHFHASSLAVVPKSHMLAWNAVFYLGPVPVFYTPFLYKSLTPTRFLGWKSQPGYDRRNGPFLKNSLTTQYSESVYSKLFADYYMRQGFGYGAEVQRHHTEDSRGALYAYRIHETASGDNRWTLLGQGYQALPSSSAFQGRFQLQSDPSFNNAYARSSLFRVTPELIDNAAFVHRFENGTARLAYTRHDVADPSGRSFDKVTESYPRLEYQSQPLRLGSLPWLNTFTGFADNSFDRTRPFIQKSVNAAWEGTRTFVLKRGVSFAPRLAYSETYYNRFDQFTLARSSDSHLDAAIGRWTTGGTFRLNTPVGHWDLTHAYTRRLQPDGFTEDTGALDKGVETNLTSLSDVFIPLPNVWAGVSGGYDFRTFRDHTEGFRDRVQPLVAEGSWSAGDRLSVDFRQDYQLQKGERALVGNARYGDDQGAVLGGGFAYNLSDPDHYYINAEFAVAPSSPTWRLGVVLRSLVETHAGVANAHGLRLFEKEIAWTKRWHDFYTKLGAAVRPGGVGEITARVDFKFGATDAKRAPRRDWEAEWFPERAGTDVLRP